MTILTYRSGEEVPHAGVYAVIHGKPHTQYRELFVDRGTFPSCQTCASPVAFRLVRAVENIMNDADFRSGGGSDIRKMA